MEFCLSQACDLLLKLTLRSPSQYGICVLGKVHMCPTSSLRNVPSVILEMGSD